MGHPQPPALPWEDCPSGYYVAYGCYIPFGGAINCTCAHPENWWQCWLIHCPTYDIWAPIPECLGLRPVLQLQYIFNCITSAGGTTLGGAFMHVTWTDDEDDPKLSDPQAYDLAVEYGLSPLSKGKFEPDHLETEDIRTMILANWHDATNVLIKYDRTQLPHWLPP